MDGWEDVSPTIKLKKAQSKTFDNEGSVNLMQLNQLITTYPLDERETAEQPELRTNNFSRNPK